MEISIKCNSLKAKYCVNGGMLRCVEPYEFTICDPKIIRITIEEIGKRIITLSCETEIEAMKLYSLLLKLERLLQIFDGAFLTLKDIVIYGMEDENSYSALVKHLKIQRLRYFSTASFVSVHSDRILNYEDVLSKELFNEWQVLLEDLGVVNQMYLYAASDCGFTNDVKVCFSCRTCRIIGRNNR